MLANEVAALRIARGQGYARLLRYDLKRRALLLERLGLPLCSLGYSTTAQLEIICTTLKASWVSVPPGSDLPSGASVAAWLAKFIADLWTGLDRPCSRQALEMALSFAQARAQAFDPKTSVLVHGDAHSGNTLQDLSQTPPAFKFIDPDGIWAEPACDLAVPMRERPDELLADPVRLGRERCANLSRPTVVDEQAIWEWGCIQYVSTGLLLLQMGQKHAGSQMLSVVDAWARE